MTLLPRDSDNTPIPALRLHPNGAHQINVTGTSTRNATAFQLETRILSLYATDAAFIQFGDSAVTATTTHHYLPAGLYYDFAIGGDKTAQYTHVAVIAAGADCVLYISEKQ